MDLFAPSHLLILLLIVLVIFGPSKLGDIGGAMGKAIRDFKKAMTDEESKPAADAAQTKSSEAKTDKLSS